MLMRLICLLFSLSVISGYANPPTTVLPQGKKIKQQRTLSAFNEITAAGAINISLHTGYSRPQVILYGDSRDLQQLRTAVRNNTLLISLGKGSPRFGAVKVEVRTRYLNRFVYQGVGTITGNKLHSGLLDLSITNPGTTLLGGDIFLGKLRANGGGCVEINGVKGRALQLAMTGNTKVKLTGVISVSNLNLSGGGSLTMYWIKSNALKVRARGRAKIQLAGVVNKLDVELCERACFKGRYLRAQTAFIKTHDKSLAQVTAVKHQHTFASDASDIYFYNIPSTKADFMAYNGAVLDMRDWSPDPMKDYDRYNK